MAERIKTADVKQQIEEVNNQTGLDLFLYSAYGKHGVRVEGRHVMEGMGTLRECSNFLNGMIAALNIKSGKF